MRLGGCGGTVSHGQSRLTRRVNRRRTLRLLVVPSSPRSGGHSVAEGRALASWQRHGSGSQQRGSANTCVAQDAVRVPKMDTDTTIVRITAPHTSRSRAHQGRDIRTA